MLPFLSFPAGDLPMYSFMISVGLTLGILIAVYRPSNPTLSRKNIVHSALWGIIGLLFGAKILFLITFFPQYHKLHGSFPFTQENIMALLRDGWVFYGGIIGAIVAMWLYCKVQKSPFIPLLENLTPSIPFMHAFGRIGCFLSGCCYGIPWDGACAVTFTAERSSAPLGIPLFPVQLLEALLNFVLFILLYFYSRKKRNPGKIFGLYLLAYPLIRFSLEFLRGDLERGVLLHVSTSQWISLSLLPLGIFLFLRKKRNQEQ